jgi:16S rRNA (uracil1498-N3)-methyltransferase
MGAVRLYTESDLATGLTVPLTAGQAHYLGNVMRMKIGDSVVLFNGRDGEWRASIAELRKKGGAASPTEQLRAQENGPDLWLLFAPVKRARIDFIAEKATELGVSAIAPVFTDNTAVSRVNEERLRTNAIEAAEQCGRLSVPDIQPAARLVQRLDDWPGDRRIMLCDETGNGAPVYDALAGHANGADPWAILCGPEGGFSPAELDRLAENSIVTRISLGPRILRADTAAIAALACWQSTVGDWRNKA